MKSFDVIVPVGPKDSNVISDNIRYNLKNVIGYRNFYLICSDMNVYLADDIKDKVIIIDEKIFPFKLEDVYNCVADKKIYRIFNNPDRDGWYLQQCLKLYAGEVIEGILDDYLVIDSDTVYLKQVSFFDDQDRLLINPGTEYHMPYFEHMRLMHPDLIRVDHNISGITHSLLYNKLYLSELFNKVESYHNNGKKFWELFFYFIQNHNSGASEIELYFNYIFRFHGDKINFRMLNWGNVKHIDPNSGHDVVSCHWYLR